MRPVPRARRRLLPGRRSALAAAAASCAALGGFATAAAGQLPDPPARLSPPAAAFDTIPGTPVVKTAEPRSYVVVAIPLPERLSGKETLAFEVVPAPGVSLLSRRSGEVRPDESTSLLLTLGVPADARAGPLPAARVTFAAPEVAPVSVAVTIEVARVRALRLAVPELVTGLYPGARRDLSVQITNAGNRADTVRLLVEAPREWEVSGGADLVALEPGQSRALSVRLRVPDRAATGDFFVRLGAGGEDHALAEALISVNVGDHASTLAVPGPRVRALLAAVGGSEPGVGALQLEALGPLTADWSIDAKATVLTGPSTTSALRGLAGVGTYLTSPTVRLWSASSLLTAGNVQGPFNEITGAGAYGRGVAGQHATGSYGTVDLMAARPRTRAEEEKGLLLGLRHSVKLRGLDVTTTAAHLDASGSRLDALGFDLQGRSRSLGQARGGLAYRDHGDGAGLGFSAAAQHSREDRHLELRAVHAPGGSSAFARARDELSGAASFRLRPRWSAGGNVFVSRDETAALLAIDSRSWSVFQQFRPRPMTTARLELRGSEFDARGEVLAFGNEELALTAGLSSLSGVWFYSLNGSLARITRMVEQEPLGRVVNRGPQMGVSGNAGWSGPAGTVQVELRHQRTEPGMGYLARQLTVGVRAERVAVTVADRPVTLNGSVLYTSWGSGRGSGATVARGGAAVPLPGDLALALAVERNPFFRTAAGGASWVFSLRLERTAVLPRLGLGSADGTVYQDLNGNGRRDDGEPGMPEALVRRGGVSARTDATGAYRFADRMAGDIVLDVSSLPAGWVLPADGRAGRRDIGVVPTSRVHVELVLVPSPLFALRPPDLARLEVLVRDGAEREWLARRIDAGAVVFDALPAGDYTLVIDAARAGEPLRPEGDEVTFRVEAGAPLQLQVPLVGRPVRLSSGGAP